MSRPAPEQTTRAQVSISNSQEREFYKYIPPYSLNGPCSQYISNDIESDHIVPRSCPDTVLTAFAQLGALKFDARRAMISLFGRSNQYVIAEATRSLSLQNDTGHDDGDSLWVGCCQLSYERSFCKHVFDQPESEEWPDQTVISVSDIREDNRFVTCRDMLEFPQVRFFASVPIVSPKGLVIGAYTILDDSPRSALDPKSSQFLKDMASTVMKHLEATKVKDQHLRAERMMVGIGSFLEGKGSLRNAWLQSHTQWQPAQKYEGVEGHINEPQQTKQIADNKARASREKTASNSKLLLPTKSGDKRQDAEPTPNNENESLSSQVADAFSRAANLARESLEVEGILYFDANFTSHGGLVNSSKSDSDLSGSDASLSDEGKRSSKMSAEAGLNDSFDTKKWTEPCGMLAHSTSDSSSINQELISDRRIAMSEKLVKGLLHRYPRGKIFNFAEDGLISSDESTDGMFKNFYQRNGPNSPKPARKYKKTRQAILRHDAQTLRQLCPDARSIIFMPLWDSHKQRWYSGCIAWTRTPHRIFTADDELTFLFSFGNSLMAEVHRLGAEYAERAKSDLLSSLSHELRSPLHGVFGTAELLGDTLLTASQHAMVHTIQSCASTLLDTINHLLEYARINKPQKSIPEAGSDSGPQDSTEDGVSSGMEPGLPKAVDDPESFPPTQLDAVLEEVMETVFAGYAFLQGSTSPLAQSAAIRGSNPFDQLNDSIRTCKIILDVNSAANWKLQTHPGKWRLVLMDLVGNALKFTRTGFVSVTVDANPTGTVSDDPNKPSENQVTLAVADTGIGIGESYLKNDLFHAFSQENTHSSGNGLGLHVAQRTIASLGGYIEVRSRTGFGTEAIAKVKLEDSPDSVTPDTTSAASVLDATRKLMWGKSIGILGVGDSTADKMLCSSLEKLCRDWFGMEICVADTSRRLFCDYYIVTREDYDLASILPNPGARFSTPIIVICSSPANASLRYAAARASGNWDVVEYISQPCGPRKMANTLALCNSNQQSKHELADTADKTGSRLSGTAPTFRPKMRRTLSEALTGSAAKVNPPLPEVKITEVSPPGTAQEDSPPSGAQSEVDKKTPEETGVDNKPAEANDTASTASSTVLIVDDNEINVRILAAFMKKLKWDYAVAHDGLEALETFKADPDRFRIILMDISMPVMDGLDSTKNIRNFEKQVHRHQAVTIAAVTGLGQADIQRDAIGSGMDFFLTKPISLKTLAPIIHDAGASKDSD